MPAVGLPATLRGPLSIPPPHLPPPVPSPAAPSRRLALDSPPRPSQESVRSDNSSSSPFPSDSDSSSHDHDHDAFPLEFRLQAGAAPPQPSASQPSQLPPQEAEDPDALPTYKDLEKAEPGNPRFGRYGSWIQKRAREGRDERDADRREGRGRKSSWNLGPRRTDDVRGVLDDDTGRERDAQAERRMSRKAEARVGVTNPDPEQDGGGSSPVIIESSSVWGSPQVPLTAATSILPLGSRFLRQVPEKPTSGVVLPVGGGRKTNGALFERFVLVGTEEGLYLTDLVPSLASSPSTAEGTSGEAIVLQLWKGLGVLQLEVYVEGGSLMGNSDSPKGLVVALVCTPGDPESAEIRMWALNSLANLATWRCFNEASEPIRMAPVSSSATGRQSHELSGGKRGSFFKSIFGDSSKIPSRDPPKSKGKGRAVPSSPTSPSADSEYVVVASPRLPLPQGSAPRYTNSIYVLDRGVGDLALSRAETSVSQSSAGGPLDRESSISSSASLFRQTIQTPSLPPTPPSPPRPPTATPPDTSASRWATAFVRLPVAKGQAHAPILFFQLMEAPARDPSTSATGNEDTLKSWDTGWLLLAASTSKGVYLFESKPALSRTWTPKPEIYAPATPRFITLVQGDPSLSTTPRSDKRSSTSSSMPSTLSDLYIFLGTRHESVLIRLSDLAVREIDIAPTARVLRAGNRFSTNTRAAVASKVAALIEGKGMVPVGMRGEEGAIAFGRRIAPGGNSDADAVRESWIGCDELILPTRLSGERAGTNPRELTRRLWVLSKEYSTAVVLSPLGSPLRGGTADVSLPRPGGGPPPLHIVPVHTFTWPSPVVKVVALLPPQTLKSDLHLHLVLVAFTKTGIHVQEGTISKQHVEALYETPRAPTPTSSSLPPFFTPTRSNQISPLRSKPTATDIDPELEDTASFDFGRATAFLTPGNGGGLVTAPCGERADDDEGEDGGPKFDRPKRTRGVFFWTAGHSDFQLKFVGAAS